MILRFEISAPYVIVALKTIWKNVNDFWNFCTFPIRNGRVYMVFTSEFSSK